MRSLSPLEDPEHSLNRAKEARELADAITHPESNNVMLKIAESYETLGSGHWLAEHVVRSAHGSRPESCASVTLICLSLMTRHRGRSLDVLEAVSGELLDGGVKRSSSPGLKQKKGAVPSRPTGFWQGQTTSFSPPG